MIARPHDDDHELSVTAEKTNVIATPVAIDDALGLVAR